MLGPAPCVFERPDGAAGVFVDHGHRVTAARRDDDGCKGSEEALEITEIVFHWALRTR
jgi:hypothetical protein